MMASAAPVSAANSYADQRDRLETYFDRTARQAWIDLTSDAPVSGIRATVRAGREAMRCVLTGWLPADMTGQRLLDAGCGTGALAIAAAERGAEVVAIDVSEGLVEVARRRAPARLAIDWQVGDMLDPGLGRFDHVVLMDSLIHYPLEDIIAALAGLAARAPRIGFTVAPRTPMLAAMHWAGGFFPRADRAPAIRPIAEARLRSALAATLPGHPVAASERVASGFYTSQAFLLAAETRAPSPSPQRAEGPGEGAGLAREDIAPA